MNEKQPGIHLNFFDYMKSLKFSFEFSTDEVDRIVIDNQKIFFENLVFSVFYKNHNKANFEFKGQIKNTIDNSEIEIKPLGSYSFQKFNFSRTMAKIKSGETQRKPNNKSGNMEIANMLQKQISNVTFLIQEGIISFGPLEKRFLKNLKVRNK